MHFGQTFIVPSFVPHLKVVNGDMNNVLSLSYQTNFTKYHIIFALFTDISIDHYCFKSITIGNHLLLFKSTSLNKVGKVLRGTSDIFRQRLQ